MNAPRIAVTGLGAVTALGSGVEAFWPRLIAGEDGVREVTVFDTSAFRTKRAGQVPDAPPGPPAGRGSRLALAAAREAFQAAALAGVAPDRVGLCLGTAQGDLTVLEEVDRLRLAGGWGAVPRELAAAWPYGSMHADVAADLGLEGPVSLLSAACASGNYALARAGEWLRQGRADAVLAGGAEPLSRILLGTFGRHAYGGDYLCRPFDRERKGVVLGEGAAFLVLERWDDAEKRGVPIVAELLGWGLSADAHHMTAPHPDGRGAVLAMERALEHAGVRPGEVGYVNAHGTGTPLNDRIEAAAIHRVFGAEVRRLPVSSVKSMLGHAMGAASAIEAAVCCLALRDGVIPPTIHYETPDPECDLDCVPNRARRGEFRFALSNSFGVGGSNAAVVFGRPDSRR